MLQVHFSLRPNLLCILFLGINQLLLLPLRFRYVRLSYLLFEDTRQITHRHFAVKLLTWILDLLILDSPRLCACSLHYGILVDSCFDIDHFYGELLLGGRAVLGHVEHGDIRLILHCFAHGEIVSFDGALG